MTAGGVNLDDTRIICRANGVEKQNASYKQMFFKIPVVIAELSRSLTLLSGDIIAHRAFLQAWVTAESPQSS
nr:fumarylacetoacetate hydrolase family protein [Polynucleobacter necessarius]